MATATGRPGPDGRSIGMNDYQVVVYTREGCHLCEEAIQLLVRHGLSPRVVDIDADPERFDQYTDCVPVVTFDGKVRFRGRVNPRLLQRLLDHRRKGT